METLFQDLRYAFRMLIKSPGFAAVAVLTLALGIGANTAIFTLINAVLLKSLPVHKPEELFVFGEGENIGISLGSPGGSLDLVSYPLYEKFRDQSQAFTGLCAFQSFQSTLSVRLDGPGGNALPEQAHGKVVSGNYFSVLGVNALIGRTLTPEDDVTEGAHPVAVISYRYWKRRFAQDPSVVGRTIGLNSLPFTIVGVAPPEFFGDTLEGDPADLWLPIMMQPQVMLQESLLKARDDHWLHLMGRLKPGLTLEQAQASLNVRLRPFLTEQAGSELSADERRRILESYVKLTPGNKGLSSLRQQYSEPLHVLMAVVGLILLIACANVANLLLARATSRQKEISMRLALGAGRARLVRQLLTESVLLGVWGGAAGLLFAFWGTSVLVAHVSGGSTYLPLSVEPDAQVLGFTIAASLVTGILFGFAPALRASRLDLTAALKESAPSLGGGLRRRGFGLAKFLVVVQVALSLSLLVGAGLFVRSLEKLISQDLGFNRERVLLVEIDPRLAGYKPTQLSSLYRQILDRVNDTAGVRSASLALYSLTSGFKRAGPVSVQGYTPQSQENLSVQINVVGPKYFETVGMSLVLGRGIGPEDTETSPQVAVINETMARYFFPGQNPVGRRFGFTVAGLGIHGSGARDSSHSGDFEIIGVVKDAKYNDLREKTPRMVYRPVFQESGDARYVGSLEVRTVGNPLSVATSVRQILNDVDKNLPVLNITTLSDQVDRSLNQERLIAKLSGFFGLLALLLACVGLYGLMAYAVARRTNEIGIRIALGALRGDILWLVLRETILLVLVGLTIGLPAALAATRLISSMLFGLTPTDPVTISMATFLLVAVAAFAGYLPARRASRVDPMVALRYE
jgi:predicted permease